MHARALAQSPLARLLIELADRHADGSIDIGGRRFVLHRGAVADISETHGDEDIGQFLVRAGTIDATLALDLEGRASSSGTTVADLLVRERHVRLEKVLEAERALFLERFVRSVRTEEAQGDGVPPFVAGKSVDESHNTYPLVPLLLDAYARRAALSDATDMTRLMEQRLEMLESPFRLMALDWFGTSIGDAGALLSTLLTLDPACAPRIASLVRTGMARLIAAESEMPPPPPRPNTLAPSAGEAREITRSYPPESSNPARMSSVPPPRPARVVLAPGGGSAAEGPTDLVTALKAYANAESSLEDPLDRVEASISRLEQSGAEGQLRAAEWKAAADIWLTRYLSVEEASRAMREAAAADPSDRNALEQSARLCAMLGDARLACAYARAAASASPRGAAREGALAQLAFYARAAGDTPAAISALRSATGADDASASVFEELADLLVAQGENEEAAECIRSAAERVATSEPARARCLYTYAATLSPARPEHVRKMIDLFVQSDMHEAAISYMAHVARTTTNPDEARSLRLDAAGRAEGISRPDLASELLLEAFDQEPQLEIVYEPLVADLEAAGAHEDLVTVIEDIAGASEDARDAWLARVETAARVSTTIGPFEAAAQKLRRAQRGRDPVLARDAYALRAELGRTPAAKSRALVGLARTLALLGDVANAATRADQALQIDAHNADAARVILQTFRALDPAHAHLALERAHVALGDSRDLFRFILEMSQETNDPVAMRRAVEVWCEIEPTFPEPIRTRYKLALLGSDPASLLSSADALLQNRSVNAHTGEAIVEAMRRLHSLHATADAIQLGLRAVDRLGADKKHIVEQLVSLCQMSSDRHAAISVFERALGPAAAADRLPWLARIASLHREQSDVAAEARTHLRILTTSLYDKGALHRLAEIYATTAEGEKLLAVLGLMLEASDDPEHRKQCLLDLAAAAHSVARDVARAEQFLSSLFQEAEGDSTWVLRAAGALVAIGRPVQAVERLTRISESSTRDEAARLLERAIAIAELAAADPALALRTAAHSLSIAPSHAPLLLVFERLALGLNELALAESVYRGLVATAYGPQTRRALFYRAARFFEKGGDGTRALQAYLDAFENAPAAGVVFNAIERLAHATENYEPLSRALLTLSEKTPHVETRVRHLKHAAEVFTTYQGDPARAFEVMLLAWETSTNKEREAEARSALGTLLRADPVLGEQARATYISAIRKHAESAWDGEERAQWILRAARVCAVEQTTPESTLVVVREAQTAFAEATPEPESRVAFLCDIAEILATWPAERAAARSLIGDALAILPDDARTRSVAADLAVPLPAPSILPSSMPEPVSTVAPGLLLTPVVEAAPDVAEGIDSAFDSITSEAGIATSAEIEERLPASPHLAISGAHVREVMASGDNDAAIRLADELSSDPTRVHEASQLLSAVLIRDPSRTTALRSLYHLALGRGARGEADMLAGFVSLFDSNVQAPRRSYIDGVNADLQAAVHVDPHSKTYAKVFAIIWETASHLYKKPLQAFHVFGTDRVTPLVQNPVAQAFFGAARLLDAIDVPLFGRRMGSNDLFVARTVPPCVVIGPTLDGEEAELLFRFGRTLTLARPTHLLLGTLDETDGRTLTNAISAAFGPSDTGPGMDKNAATLAAELWRIMPPRAQREVRDLLATLSEPLSYDSARGAVFSQAARAGLLACGDSRAAALALRSSETSLASADLASESGWQAACKSSHVLRELVRFALSSTWLTAIGNRR